MIVTQMTGMSRSRCKVYVDGQFAFVLYTGELREFGIEEEKEISETCYQQIMTELLPRRAKKRALNLLEAKDYTSGQLREKLRQGEYPPACIDEAIAYVESYGYHSAFVFFRDKICHLLALQSRYQGFHCIVFFHSLFHRKNIAVSGRRSFNGQGIRYGT